MTGKTGSFCYDVMPFLHVVFPYRRISLFLGPSPTLSACERRFVQGADTAESKPVRTHADPCSAGFRTVRVIMTGCGWLVGSRKVLIRLKFPDAEISPPRRKPTAAERSTGLTRNMDGVPSVRKGGSKPCSEAREVSPKPGKTRVGCKLRHPNAVMIGGVSDRPANKRRLRPTGPYCALI